MVQCTAIASLTLLALLGAAVLHPCMAGLVELGPESQPLRDSVDHALEPAPQDPMLLWLSDPKHHGVDLRGGPSGDRPGGSEGLVMITPEMLGAAAAQEAPHGGFKAFVSARAYDLVVEAPLPTAAALLVVPAAGLLGWRRLRRFSAVK